MSHAVRILRGAGLAAFLGIIGLGSAQAGTEVALTIRDSGAPLIGAQVEIFLSNDHLIGQTNDDGFVGFQIESGRGFWVEVDGERLAEFFLVDQAPIEIELSEMGTIQWEGR